MGQFHVTVYVNNPRSAQLATAAMLDRTLVAMGSDIDEDVEIVTGFVQSIEEDADAVPRRWRITIRGLLPIEWVIFRNSDVMAVFDDDTLADR
jgi:hypothetical protein